MENALRWLIAQLYRGVPIAPSGRFEQWLALMLSPTTCLPCKEKHGTIYDIRSVSIDIALDLEEFPDLYDGKKPPLHVNCRCRIGLLGAIQLGTADISGKNGADWFIAHYGELPPGYVGKEYARAWGWDQTLGNLWHVLPGKIIGGDVFKNKKGKLPRADGRVWYEADLNYFGGYRSTARLLYSNDGLLFVTYDHYMTFKEVY